MKKRVRHLKFDAEVNQDKLFYSEEDMVVRECPLCLYQGSNREFLFARKSGDIATKRRCPSCRQTISLNAFENHEQHDRYKYGAWLYEYILAGGFEKIIWDSIKFRLSRYPSEADKFWKGFKDRKIQQHKEHPTQEDIEHDYEEYSRHEDSIS